MTFRELLDIPGVVDVRGPDVVISDIAIDSRRVCEGSAFIARKGWYSDGHTFIDAALKRGASALVVSDPDVFARDFAVPVALVESEDPFLGLASARFFGQPTHEVPVFGVTGTNGKTSTVWILEALLREIGERPAVLSTVNYRFENQTWPAPNTTPDGIVIQRFVRDVIKLGATCVVMEVSSHGVELQRIAGTKFSAAGFTNFSRDHLDFHESMESYFAAKRRFFSDHVGDGVAAAIVDGERGSDMLDATPVGARRIRVSVESAADISASVSEQAEISGTPFTLDVFGERAEGRLHLAGRHNLQNYVLAAAMVHGHYGTNVDTLARAASRVPPIPGRFEAPVEARDGEPYTVVDYAHTPDAVARVAEVLGSFDSTHSLMIVGCGGDRDATKRPMMAAAPLAHVSALVITSDNPRSEDAEVILDQMEAGVDAAHKAQVRRIADRSEAIEHALRSDARLIAVTGKGHEDYQIKGTRRYYLDDRDEVRRGYAGLREGAPSANVPLVRGWSTSRLAAAIQAVNPVRDRRQPLGNVRTDSRKVGEGDVFFALCGDRFDAHSFVPDVVQAGAAVVVTDRDMQVPETCTIMVVDDTTAALGRLAHAIADEARRREGGLSTLAITGSNGKTTTRSMAAALLNAGGSRVLETPGNFNNHVGLPLTIFALTPAHRNAVLEMGANRPGDIRDLCAIASPDVAIVTSIGAAHTEGFGDIAGVRRAKCEIVRDGRPQVLVVPHNEARNGWLDAAADVGATVYTFGGSDATIEVSRDGHWGTVRLTGHGALRGFGAECELAVPGTHNAENLAAALLGVWALHSTEGAEALPDAALVARVAASLAVPGARLRQNRIAGLHVIDDAYNANPASMRASLAILGDCGAPRVAVLGEMRELGDASAAMHREVGAAAAAHADIVVGVGDAGAWIVDGAASAGGRAVAASNAAEAAQLVISSTNGVGTVLVKGSRGARLEEVVAALQSTLEAS